MKKYILYSMLLALSVSSLTSCSEDSLDDHSIIKSSQTEDNAFDKWLTANYINPYNIRFEYRYDDNETDMDYFNVPADYDKAVKLAHIVKYACIEAYDAVGGVAFTRNYFPQLLYTTGEFEYRNNGTMILGTAEGGRKIFLAGTNKLDTYGSTRDGLNEYYLKTIHHEFTHILNQTKDYSPSLSQVHPICWMTGAAMKARAVILLVVSSQPIHSTPQQRISPRCYQPISPILSQSGIVG